MSKAAALEEMYLIYKVIRDYLVAGAKLGMRPEYCGGQLAKPVDAHTRPGCHNEGKL